MDTILTPRITPRITLRVLRVSPQTTCVVESLTTSVKVKPRICPIAFSTIAIVLQKNFQILRLLSSRSKNKATYSEWRLVQTMVGVVNFFSLFLRTDESLKSAKLSRRGGVTESSEVDAGWVFFWCWTPFDLRWMFEGWEKQGWAFLIRFGLSSGVKATSGSWGNAINCLDWKSSFLRGNFSSASSVFSFRFLATEAMLERVFRFWLLFTVLLWDNGDFEAVNKADSCVGVWRGSCLSFALRLGVETPGVEPFLTSEIILRIDNGGGSRGEK